MFACLRSTKERRGATFRQLLNKVCLLGADSRTGYVDAPIPPSAKQFMQQCAAGGTNRRACMQQSIANGEPMLTRHAGRFINESSGDPLASLIVFRERFRLRFHCPEQNQSDGDDFYASRPSGAFS